MWMTFRLLQLLSFNILELTRMVLLVNIKVKRLKLFVDVLKQSIGSVWDLYYFYVQDPKLNYCYFINIVACLQYFSWCFVVFRFIRSVGIIDTVSARKFLEAAMNTDDHMLFYTVFKFFEQRNIRLRQNPRFPPGNITLHCEQAQVISLIVNSSLVYIILSFKVDNLNFQLQPLYVHTYLLRKFT